MKEREERGEERGGARRERKGFRKFQRRRIVLPCSCFVRVLFIVLELTLIQGKCGF